MKKTMKRAICLLLVLTMLSTLVVYSEPVAYDEWETFSGIAALSAPAILPNSGVKMFAAGAENSAFITNDGRLFVFGYNEQQQISSSGGIAISAPIEIAAPSGTTWSDVAVGGMSYYMTQSAGFGSMFAAIASDGSLWT